MHKSQNNPYLSWRNIGFVLRSSRRVKDGLSVNTTHTSVWFLNLAVLPLHMLNAQQSLTHIFAPSRRSSVL